MHRGATRCPLLGLTDYIVDATLYESAKSTVFRARRRVDGSPVVIKWLSSATPDRAAFARYRYAFQLGSDLELEGVCRTLELIEISNRPALVMPDRGGQSLRGWLHGHGRPTVGQTIELAIRASDALGRLHAAHVVHRDINPSNLVVDPALSWVEIIDFDVATRLRRESLASSAVRLLEGTLPYMSPEQTGRVNRPVDHRTDLYALGVTLYELLAGERPFVGDDPLALVHAHLAVTPKPLHERDPTVPRSLSKIVDKLLVKEPDRRYQSAAGLRRDLERCRELVTAGRGDEALQLGVGDLSPWLQVSQRLVGRDDEIAALRARLGASMEGRRELLLVRGFAGVGKTRLVREVLRDVSLRNGALASGKFDQLSNAPHAGLIDAVRGVVREILAGSDSELAAWRQRLQAALRLNAAVMIEVIPELAPLFDAPPRPPMLAPAEALGRFQRVFVAMMRCFAREDHPLVLFLDDLQWAQTNSLDLIAALLADEGCSHLLIVGALRDEDSAGRTRVDLWRGRLAAQGMRAAELVLKPLTHEATASLLAESLRAPPDDAFAALVEAVFARTHGNPFFVEQLLRRLEQDEALWPDLEAGRWCWALERLEALGISDQVADLLAERIATLPDATIDALRHAACLGASFELDALAAVLDRAPARVFRELWPAMQQEIVLAPDSGWRDLEGGEDESTAAAGADVTTAAPRPALALRFAHDRLQEAAYARISPDQRAHVHLAIARRLQATSSPGTASFKTTNHFNLGVAALVDPAERLQVAERNAAAAQAAMAAGAFSKAWEYADAGFSLLGERPFDDHHELALKLARLRADSAQLEGRYAEAVALAEQVLAHARTPLERQDGYDLRIAICARVSDPAVMQFGMQAWQELTGVEPPSDPQQWMAAAMREGGEIMARMAGRDPMELRALPPMRDPMTMLEMRLLANLVGPAYSQPERLPFIAMRLVRLSIEHGQTPFSPMGYMTYAVLLCMQGQFGAGSRFGELGLSVAQAMGARAMEAPLRQIYGPFVEHWSDGLDAAARSLDAAIGAGVETGSYLFAGWAANNQPLLALVRGLSLDEVLDACARTARTCAETLNYADGVLLARKARARTLQIIGRDREVDQAALDGELSTANVFGEFDRYAQLHGAMVRHDVAQARALLDEIAPRARFLTVHFFLPAYRLANAWVLASEAATVPAETRAASRATLAEIEGQFATWSQVNAPAHAPSLWLVRAELALLDDDLVAAEAHFDRSVEAARESGVLHLEAIACERAAVAFGDAGKLRTARSFLADAHDALIRYGATGRVRQLERLHPRLRRQEAKSSTDVTTDRSDAALDMDAALRASQAISSELQLDDLLRTVMRTVIQSAGAQRAALLLRRDARLLVEAWVDGVQTEPTLLQGLPPEQVAICEPIVRQVERSERRVVIADASKSERWRHDPQVAARGVRSVLCTPIVDKGRLIGVLYLENNLVPDAFTDDRCQLLDILGAQAAISIQNALFYEARERERASMARFVPREFVQLLGKDELTSVQLGDAVEREVGVLFSDLRGFTALSASMRPMEIFAYLNGYLERAGPVIRSHGGFIDKYIGDAILAMFPEDATQAVAAIVALQRQIDAYNIDNRIAGRPEMSAGVALHWGPVALGTIGEVLRLDATAISDTVNTASRLEGLTKSWGTRAIVSGDALDRIADPSRFPHRYIGEVVLRGRNASTPIFDLIAIEPDDVIAIRLETRPSFEAAVRALHARDLRQGIDLLQEVVARDGGDRVAAYLLAKAQTPRTAGDMAGRDVTDHER